MWQLRCRCRAKNLGARLAARAWTEGYALGSLFIDIRGRESGLYGLLDYLRREEAPAVVVPDMGHLTHGGCLAGATRQTAQRFLRAYVLTLDDETR